MKGTPTDSSIPVRRCCQRRWNTIQCDSPARQWSGFHRTVSLCALQAQALTAVSQVSWTTCCCCTVPTYTLITDLETVTHTLRWIASTGGSLTTHATIFTDCKSLV